MKAKELIKELQKLVKENGDCDIFINQFDDDGSCTSMEADCAYVMDGFDEDEGDYIEISSKS